MVWHDAAKNANGKAFMCEAKTLTTTESHRQKVSQSWAERAQGLMELGQSLEVHLWPFGRVTVWVPVLCRASGSSSRGSPMCEPVEECQWIANIRNRPRSLAHWKGQRIRLNQADTWKLILSRKSSFLLTINEFCCEISYITIICQ